MTSNKVSQHCLQQSISPCYMYLGRGNKYPQVRRSYKINIIFQCTPHVHQYSFNHLCLPTGIDPITIVSIKVSCVTHYRYFYYFPTLICHHMVTGSLNSAIHFCPQVIQEAIDSRNDFLLPLYRATIF